ncbi:GTPase IMAP family member 8-like [Brienomyrus brachyistius]|uniref:GTPase IMAP family member 8-like n=1 Tax=Brienomyrus brachyistius TaxID=42636 RepID=UPI0020B34C51|nr:GTPase IMAP family member 8-like [Brienomyrus brachyistius]
MVAGNSGCDFEVDRMMIEKVEEKKRSVEERGKQRMMKVENQRKALRALFKEQTQDLSDLRIVLLGGRWTGKSSAGNTILGREEFVTEGRTAQCVKRQREVAGRQVTVVDTPGWGKDWSVHGTPEADKQEIVHSVSLCPPGPCALFIVLRVDASFTETHRRSVEEHLELLSGSVWRHTIVLFTVGDWLGDRTIEQHIEAEGEALQWLVGKCGNRYHVLNNEERGDVTQVTELLEKVEEMVAGNSGCHFEIDRVMIEIMEEKKRSVEERAKQRMMKVENQRKTLRALFNGPCALFIVLRADLSFTETHRRSVEQHLELLIGSVCRHTIVLFTVGDWLGDRTIEQHIEAEGEALQWLVGKCGNWYHVLNNQKRGDVTQVTELLEKVEEMVAGNSGCHFEIDRVMIERMEEKKRSVEERAKQRMMKVENQRKALRALFKGGFV